MWNLRFLFNSLFYLVLSLLKSAEFSEMCPRGKGFVPAGESSYETGGENYKGQSQMHMSFQHVSVTLVGAWFGLQLVEFSWAMETGA